MKIFNSLGSNYDFNFLVKGLINIFVKNKSEKLTKLLESKYGGKSLLFYKGRQAIEAALKISSLPKGSVVAINGLTCYVVYKAVTNAGYKSKFLDIENDLNFSQKALGRVLKENRNIKAVIIQNTLGIPADVLEIKKICQKNNIILIEDLAHSVGTKYKDNIEAGQIGDFVALSFSQDKIIDSVSGGALIIRNKKYQNNINNIVIHRVPLYQIIKDLFYPYLTYLIRNLYGIKIGKILHRIFKEIKILSNPMSKLNNGLYNLPRWHTNMAYDYFLRFEKDMNHRRKIVKIYEDLLDRRIKLSETSNIRFPILVENRDKLINFLKSKGIYISDIWYDSPIAPVKYLKLTNYKYGTCPNAEKLSTLMLNLPTHKNILEKDAIYISKLINQWINTK